MRKFLPFLLVPVPAAMKASRGFLGISRRIEKVFPGLELDLKQAEFGLRRYEYISLMLFAGISTFLLGLVLITITLAVIRQLTPANQLLALLASAVLGFLPIMYLSKYPSFVLKRKVTAIERNLLFAIRHMVIKVRSGVSLYNAMLDVSKGSYGEVSKEFRRIAKEMASGVSEKKALEKAALRTPSTHFRRFVWQISNAMGAGADLGGVLQRIVESLSTEQKTAIKKYGSELNPLAVVYLVISVIFPPLGVTTLIVLGNIFGMSISESLFFLILAAVIVFNIIYLGLIKGRRPVVEVI